MTFEALEIVNLIIKSENPEKSAQIAIETILNAVKESEAV